MVSPEGLNARDVLDLGVYERVRPRYRELVARLRQQRRVRIGDAAVLLFENRETVLWQVQEVLRCEGGDPARVVADYDAIVPRPGELRATLMIDGATQAVARAIATALQEDGAIDLRCDRVACPSVVAAPTCGVMDPVWYLRWRPAAAWRDCLRDGAPLSLRPRWSSGVVLVPACTRRELAADLDGSRLPLLDTLADFAQMKEEFKAMAMV